MAVTPPPDLLLLAGIHLFFAVLDVLARDRIVLLRLHFVRRFARILFVNINVSGVRRADELDPDASGLGHGELPSF